MLAVDQNEQAFADVVVGDTVTAINGTSCVGMSMTEAAGLIMQGPSVELTIKHAPAAPQTSEDTQLVTLDRSGGKKLGLRIGDAPSESAGVPVLAVDQNEQAFADVVVGDTVTAINGTSCVGMSMTEAAGLMMQGPSVELTIKHAPAAPQTSEDTQLVTLDRSGGKKLGLRIGDAPSESAGVPVLAVDQNEQAFADVVVGDTVTAINGTSCVGMSMTEAAGLMMQGPSVELTIKHAPAAPQTSEDTQLVTLDRSGGKKLGLRIGDAPSESAGVPCAGRRPKRAGLCRRGCGRHGDCNQRHQLCGHVHDRSRWPDDAGTVGRTDDQACPGRTTDK